MLQSTTIIAFDQHAATTVAAVLLPAHRTAAIHPLTSDVTAIVRFVARVQRQGAVTCCYEAGPCGFELQRALTTKGIPCDVIAPALIPRRPGDRIKTDRRTPATSRSSTGPGRSPPFTFPPSRKKPRATLLRCREDIRADLLRARHRLSKFLLRHGRRFTATKTAWSKRHDAWLRAQTWPLPALDQTHRAYLRGVDEIVARLRDRRGGSARVARSRAAAAARPTTALLPRDRRSHRPDDRRRARRSSPLCYGPEHDGVRRPRPVRALERCPKRAQGGITKTGNAHLRRVLVESAWHYRHHPFVSAAAPGSAARRAGDGHRLGVDRATAAASSLRPTGRARQTQATHRHRRGARTHRLRLGRADPVI